MSKKSTGKNIIEKLNAMGIEVKVAELPTYNTGVILDDTAKVFGIGKTIEENKARTSTESFGDSEETTSFESWDISILEFAVYNNFLSKCRNTKIEKFKTLSYGSIRGVNAIEYGRNFIEAEPWWFIINYDDKEYPSNMILHTVIYQNSNGRMCTELRISFEEDMPYKKAQALFDTFHNVAFNNSDYKGKVLSVDVHEGCFEGIEIIDTKDFERPLILNKTQEKFINHFEKVVSKGGQLRLLLNGSPGSGKTDSIRRLMKRLTPDATFVIPNFTTSDDLKTIMTACEVFKPGVIVFDDIDLYLGSRENGSYTRMLGDFLTFFDGIKKRKISLLASTNDKNLVDKAAERPGRFNLTIDFSYLDEYEQIVDICKIYLPIKWQIDEVYETLTGKDKAGNKIKVTGAFIANLAENIREMSEDDPEWTLEDTLFLIRESYAGFYSSQLTQSKKLGF